MRKKKILALMLALSLVALILAGCGGMQPNNTKNNTPNNVANNEENESPATTEGTYKLGLGVVNRNQRLSTGEGDNLEVLPVGQMGSYGSSSFGC